MINKELIEGLNTLVSQAQSNPESVKNSVDDFLELVVAGLMCVYPNATPEEMKDILIFTANCPYESNTDVGKVYGAVKLFLKIYMGVEELTLEELEEMAMGNISIMKAVIQRDSTLINDLSQDMKEELGI